MEAERILSEIKDLISELKKYTYIQKVIMSRDGLIPEMNAKVREMYRLKNPDMASSNVYRFDPILIEVVEELGQLAEPLYIEYVDIIPGQKIDFIHHLWDTDYTISKYWDFE